ncbi:MAG: hypothetical protein ABIO05_02940 [Ferruginibacter sp.]
MDTENSAEQALLRKKWQIALRRYVIDNNPSLQYAPYFALNATLLKEWLQSQFHKGINWDNFAEKWHLNNVVSPIHFDLNVKDDKKLCWNFINIKVQENDQSGLSEIGARSYFNKMYKATGYIFCLKMLDKLTHLEGESKTQTDISAAFILKNAQDIETIATLSETTLQRINKGVSLHEIRMENEIIKKFGKA